MNCEERLQRRRQLYRERRDRETEREERLSRQRESMQHIGMLPAQTNIDKPSCSEDLEEIVISPTKQVLYYSGSPRDAVSVCLVYRIVENFGE